MVNVLSILLDGLMQFIISLFWSSSPRHAFDWEEDELAPPSSEGTNGGVTRLEDNEGIKILKVVQLEGWSTLA